MWARTVEVNSKGLCDVSKQLLIWIFKEKRKFSTAKVKWTYDDKFYDRFGNKNDNEYNRRHEYNDRYNDGFSRNRNPMSGRYRDSFNNQYNSNRRMRKPSYFKDSFNVEPSPDWSTIDLKPFNRDFYNPHPNVLNRSPEEIENFYQRHNIKVFGQSIPPPIFNFEELGLPEEVSSYIRNLNFEEPTPIQSLTWPIALSGRDLVGISRTGSGKTLGYILPAIIHIRNQPKVEQNEGPIALVLAPTRELVQQIQGVTHPLAWSSRIRSASLFGGASKITQMNEIRNIKEIYVATPGRLLDFLNDGLTNLQRCTYLVLDEADQMLDMGFEDQIRSIINRIRPDRQVLMYSATWPRDIRDLANDFLKKYIKIQVGSSELTANPNITQIIHVCQESEKINLLLKLLNEIKQEPENKTLIFAQTKYNVERVGRLLMSRGFYAKTLHGDHSQRLRDNVMQTFRSGGAKLLVATNVAGRGLDVTDIKYVINYDFPQTVEEYVHKIGRTARSNDSGTSHSFFTPENAGLAQELVSVLESTNQIISPELKEMVTEFKSVRYQVLN